MSNEANFFEGALTAIAVVLAILIVMLVIIVRVCKFSQERYYVKMEMQRSDDEREYKHWKRELRILWLKQIPIVGHFIHR